MRFGGPLLGEKFDKPEAWIARLKQLDYSAAYCPLDPMSAADDAVTAFAQAAKDANIVIAEVGAWSNLIAPDEKTRRPNIEKNIKALALAERIGACCAVNIVGSRGAQWNGPHPDNFSCATFDLIVQVVREIVDTVKPARASYTLEMMGWGYPSSAEEYLALIKAVDRPAFGVHLDPVNLVNCPQRFYDTAGLLTHTIRLLGPHIRSVHAKDVVLGGKHLLHLDEAAPGQGVLDYPVFLRELQRLGRDIPIMMEHLKTMDEYAAAAKHIRSVATACGVSLA